MCITLQVIRITFSLTTLTPSYMHNFYCTWQIESDKYGTFQRMVRILKNQSRHRARADLSLESWMQHVLGHIAAATVVRLQYRPALHAASTVRLSTGSRARAHRVKPVLRSLQGSSPPSPSAARMPGCACLVCSCHLLCGLQTCATAV